MLNTTRRPHVSVALPFQPANLQADQTGTRLEHRQALLPQAFCAMGAGRLELPQSCDLRILSPSKKKSQEDVWGQTCLKRA
jgi:hypothetical protein